MTLFKNEYHSTRHMTMTGELRTSRPKAGSKRSSSLAYRPDYEVEYDSYPEDVYDRVLDYQRVPSSVMAVPAEPVPAKRWRGPASPSSSSSSGRHGSRDRLHRSRGARGHAPRTKDTLKMAELLAIKRELTLIKVQIDGLLDSVDKMDRQRKEPSESPPTREGSVSDSPLRGSLSSLDSSPVSPLHRQRESPPPGDTSDHHHHHHHHHHRIGNHHSDLEDL